MMHYLKQIKSLRDILPVLMVILTKKDRHLPKLTFNWSGNVSHSLLMCYYALFWRQGNNITGDDMIIPGPLTWYQDSTGRREVYINNFFGVLMFIEHELIRPLFRWEVKWKEVRVLQPAFATPFAFQQPSVKIPYLFAIAFEEGEGSATATDNNPRLTNVEGSGTDSLLIGQFNWGNARTWDSGPTFGGSGMTIISGEVNTADGTPFLRTYRLVNPSTSSGTMSGNISGSSFWIVLAGTWSGIDQTTPTADEGSNAGGPYNLASPLTISSTSDRNGSWQFASCKQDSGAAAIAATTGSLRQGHGATTINAILDGNATVASGGAGNVTITWSGGGQLIGFQKCMLRSQALPPSGPTNLKTYNTNLATNIKTIDTNAYANVKTLNTNA